MVQGALFTNGSGSKVLVKKLLCARLKAVGRNKKSGAIKPQKDRNYFKA